MRRSYRFGRVMSDSSATSVAYAGEGLEVRAVSPLPAAR
jgi:hypothetical protein